MITFGQISDLCSGRRAALGSRAVLTLLLLASFACLGRYASAADPAETTLADLPNFAYFETYVREHFAERNIQARDIIARSEVRRVLEQLRVRGWAVPDGRSILAASLIDHTYLIRALRTPEGTKFMRQVSRYGHAYDRLQRLSEMPDGRQTIHDLIKGPDGYKMIEYMTETTGGENLGKELSESRDGKDFNKPTGNIFTVDDLVKRLKKSHELTLKKLAEEEAEADNERP